MIFSGAWKALRKWQTLTKAHSLLSCPSRFRWFQPNLISSFRKWTILEGECLIRTVDNCSNLIRISSVYLADTSPGGSKRAETMDCKASSGSSSGPCCVYPASSIGRMAYSTAYVRVRWSPPSFPKHSLKASVNTAVAFCLSSTVYTSVTSVRTNCLRNV